MPNVLLPGEKTGAELLQDILAERQKKENEGKGKKAKKLTLSTIEEEPWDLPNGWCWCKLGDAISLLSGRDLEPDKYNANHIGIPYITGASNFDNGTLLINRWTPKPGSVSKTGDLLITCKGTVGELAFNTIGDIHIARQIMAISAIIIDSKYIQVFLKAEVSDLNAQANGVIPGISREDILLADFPLPPLSIQKAIVEKIEELFPLVDEYDKAAVELNTLNELLPDKLRKSVLQEAIHGNLVSNDIPDGEATAQDLLLTILKERQDRENKEKGNKAKKLTLSTVEEEPWDLPEGGCWCKLGDLFYKVTDGTHSTPKYMPSGVPFVSVKDISKGRIDFSNTKFISIEEHSELIKRCRPQRGDLLLTKVGTTGIPVIVDTDKEFSLFVSVALCKHIDGHYNLKYILNAINSPFIQSKIAEDTLGAANKNWVIDKIMNTMLPLPPLSIQHRIVAKIEEVFAAIDKLQE